MNGLTKNEKTKPWMKLTLRLAALYNILWGAWVILFPSTIFNWLQMPSPQPVWVWQCLGMVIGVYGVGYAIASRDPDRHWAVVFVGLLGKIFGPVGFLYYAIKGELPWHFGWALVFNDLIWWIPFTFILIWVLQKYRYHHKQDFS